MTTIALEGIHVHAYHGFYEEEQIIGNDFVVNIYIDANTSKAAKEDDLFSTVNYEMVYHICLAEMKKTTKLIETVAHRIVERINEQFDKVGGVKVEIKKLNPPVGGKVDAASVTVTSGIFDVPDMKSMEALKTATKDMKGLEAILKKKG